jgi:hypothetical protein
LETDAEILAQKATAALKNYGVSLVVANMLQSYQRQLILFTKAGEQIHVTKDEDADIERKLVQICIDQHAKHVEQQP